MCAYECVCAGVGQRSASCPSFITRYIYDLSLRPSLSPNLKLINLARLNDFRGLPASAHLVLRLPAHATMPDFYMSFGYTNQDLQALFEFSNLKTPS